MRIRVRGPSGVVTLTIADSATVGDFQKQISEVTSVPDFDIKLGYPPKTLNMEEFERHVLLSDTGLKLDGEQLIVIPRDIQSQLQHPFQHAHSPPNPEAVKDLPRLTGKAPTSAIPPSFAAQSMSNASTSKLSASKPAAPLQLERKGNPSLESDPPEIQLQNRGGTLLLRVMPDDNSCLFRAIGTAAFGTDLDNVTELRSMVAQEIQRRPEEFNKAILEQEPDDYCRWIQQQDSWGGGIELGVLSQSLGYEICSVNVQDGRVDRFNEGQAKRIIVVYSGIHYDTIALNYDPVSKSPEVDEKVFETGPEGEDVLQGAVELCAKLRERHYYTDTARFTIKCKQCGWEGNGERSATEHANQTLHTEFDEA